MIYVLLGKSCSGKSTILDLLKKDGYKSIITCTTRPKRENEVDGESYRFLTDHEFCKLNDFNLLVAKFEAKNGWKYGVNVQDIVENKDSVIIVEPNGYQDLINHFGLDNVHGIYLDVPLHVRIERVLKRNDDPKEFVRRLSTDHTDFIGIEEKAKTIIDLHDKEKVYKAVKKIIDKGGF